MKCNIKCNRSSNKCPKCGRKLKTDKCKCGHRIVYKSTNEEWDSLIDFWEVWYV